MNTLVVFTAVVAAASAQLIASPYAAGIGALPWNYANAYGYGLPLNAYAAAPLAKEIAAPIAAPLAAAIPAPVVPYSAPSSQFQAQDEFGNINYGYSNINSAKQEVGNTYGGVTGSYSYVDANGVPQRVDYIADGAGFRVKATNLPVAPATPVAAPLSAPVFDLVGPAPVEDTAEVKAAKAEFQAKFEEAASRAKRDAEPFWPYAGALPYAANYPYNAYNLGYNAYNLGYNYAPFAAYNAPLAAYSAPLATPAAAVVPSQPATAEAVLTKVKLNPGHALFYKVD